MQVEIFTLNDASQWKDKLQNFPLDLIDVYFYPEYFMSWENCGFGDPVCIYAKIGSTEVLYPFFKNEIKGYDVDDSYYDISSAYGYGGAISSNCTQNTESEKFIFTDFIADWCKKEKVIAEFIREYPGATFRHTQGVNRTLVRTNILVDTSRDIKTIYSNLSDNALRNIRYAEKNGLLIDVDEELETINNFFSLYSETAIDRRFNIFYHFPEYYFTNIKKYLNDKSIIINAIYKNTVVAAVLCFYSGNKLTYHLGGSYRENLSLRPNDLLYWGMIQEANKRGYKWLHLGGGMSTKSNDNLFRFKKKYGSHEIPIFIETCVHNKAMYEYICHQWELSYPQLQNKVGHYFLRYREHDKCELL